MAGTQLDFGYPWWLTYGHLVVTAPALGLLLVGFARKWSKVAMGLIGGILLWSIAALAANRVGLNANGRATLPTQSFFPSGAGRVLDMGAGTGRSSIMVLEARPQATLVALDLFADSYVEHFGPGGNPQEKLLANFKAAGVVERASIQAGDMRKLPFEPASFDAIVSSYAIDHLNRQGITEALAEAGRVLKPGGDFLLMVITKEPWLQFTFGPLLLHSGMRGAEWWTGRVEDAGFQVLEQGTRPATLYLLAGKGCGGTLKAQEKHAAALRFAGCNSEVRRP